MTFLPNSCASGFKSASKFCTGRSANRVAMCGKYGLVCTSRNLGKKYIIMKTKDYPQIRRKWSDLNRTEFPQVIPDCLESILSISVWAWPWHWPRLEQCSPWHPPGKDERHGVEWVGGIDLLKDKLQIWNDFKLDMHWRITYMTVHSKMIKSIQYESMIFNGNGTSTRWYLVPPIPCQAIGASTRIARDANSKVFKLSPTYTKLPCNLPFFF